MLFKSFIYRFAARVKYVLSCLLLSGAIQNTSPKAMQPWATCYIPMYYNIFGQLPCSCSCQGQEFPCSGFSFRAVRSLRSAGAELWVYGLSQWGLKSKVKLPRAHNQLVEPRYHVLFCSGCQRNVSPFSPLYYSAPGLYWRPSGQKSKYIDMVIPEDVFGSRYWHDWLLGAGVVPLAGPLLTPALPGTCCWARWVGSFSLFKS